jgi:hypothetical protein
LALLMGLAIAGFALVYLRFVHYDRVAATHVPPGTVMAARIDLGQVILFEPLRKHVFAVLNEQRSTNESPVLERLQQKTGISLAMDLREVVFTRGPKSEWAVIIGGIFPSHGVASGMLELLQEEGVTGCQLEGEVLACQEHGIVARQADDGVIVVASSREQLERGLTPSETFTLLGLPKDGAGALVVDRALFAPLVDNPLARLLPGMNVVQQVQALRANLELSSQVKVMMRVLPRADVPPQQFAAQAEQLVGAFRALGANVGGHIAAQQLFARASVAGDGEGIVIQSFFTRDELELFAQQLASVLRAALSSTR